MNTSELRDNLLTFIVAGHETTALTLAWSLYLCAFDPSVQDKARAELLQGLYFRDGTRYSTSIGSPFSVLGREAMGRRIADVIAASDRHPGLHSLAFDDEYELRIGTDKDSGSRWYGDYAARIRGLCDAYNDYLTATAPPDAAALLVAHFLVTGARIGGHGAPRGERELHMGRAYAAAEDAVPPSIGPRNSNMATIITAWIGVMAREAITVAIMLEAS